MSPVGIFFALMERTTEHNFLKGALITVFQMGSPGRTIDLYVHNALAGRPHVIQESDGGLTEEYLVQNYRAVLSRMKDNGLPDLKEAIVVESRVFFYGGRYQGIAETLCFPGIGFKEPRERALIEALIGPRPEEPTHHFTDNGCICGQAS